MSLIDDIIQRSRNDESRAEDYSQIYYEGGESSILEEGEYCGLIYKIESTSRRPVVRIKDPTVIKKRGKSDFVTLPDRNGENKIFLRWNGELTHDYNFGGDFILNYRDGKKYTVDELKKDVISFIDSLVKYDQMSK